MTPSTSKSDQTCSRCGLASPEGDHGVESECIGALREKVDKQSLELVQVKSSRTKYRAAWLESALDMPMMTLRPTREYSEKGLRLVKYLEEDLTSEKLGEILQLGGIRSHIKKMAIEHGRASAWTPENLDLALSTMKRKIPILLERKLVPKEWLEWPKGQKIINMATSDHQFRYSDFPIKTLETMRDAGYPLPNWVKTRIFKEAQGAVGDKFIETAEVLLDFDELSSGDLVKLVALLNEMPRHTYEKGPNLYKKLLDHSSASVAVALEMCSALGVDISRRAVIEHGGFLDSHEVQEKASYYFVSLIREPRLAKKLLVTITDDDMIEDMMTELQASKFTNHVCQIIDLLPKYFWARHGEKYFRKLLAHDSREVRSATILKTRGMDIKDIKPLKR